MLKLYSDVTLYKSYLVKVHKSHNYRVKTLWKQTHVSFSKWHHVHHIHQPPEIILRINWLWTLNNINITFTDKNLQPTKSEVELCWTSVLSVLFQQKTKRKACLRKHRGWSISLSWMWCYPLLNQADSLFKCFWLSDFKELFTAIKLKLNLQDTQCDPHEIKHL